MNDVRLIESVKIALDSIINDENYETPPEIDVIQGSEDGDGYSSKTYAISIKSENRKPLQLFVKYLPEEINAEWKVVIAKIFRTEHKFYSEIYPAFHEFQVKKNIKGPFDNVPKHYGKNVNNCVHPPIILENLRCLGYALKDRKKPTDDVHLKLPIQTFAKFHAISYAMKDQQPEEFRKLSTGTIDIFAHTFTSMGMDKMISKCVDQLLESLDPVSDEKFLSRCKNLTEVLVEHSVNIPANADEYAVFTQGDCWSGNMMFLYDNNTGLPKDVKLIDWQCVRLNSPLLDFSHFFYSSASKEALDNSEYYLNLYYDTIYQRIKELGSDPEKVFPHHVFIEHWKKFSLFGLTMAFCIVKVQLFDKNEVPDLLKQKEPIADLLSVVVKEQDKYISRMRDIIEYFMNHELL